MLSVHLDFIMMKACAVFLRMVNKDSVHLSHHFMSSNWKYSDRRSIVFCVFISGRKNFNLGDKLTSSK